MSDSLLQLLLLANVFVIGALTAVAIRHAYAHFHPPAQHEPEKTRPHVQRVQLPADVRERLLRSAQTNFESILNRTASELQHDLKTTSLRLNQHLEKLGTKIVSDEMARYHVDLAQLRQQAESTITAAQADIVGHQSELQAKLAEQKEILAAEMKKRVAAEEVKMMDQIDTKIGDAVSSFLLETMQHNVDLGAQSDYLLTMLEEHKAELVKGVKSEI